MGMIDTLADYKCHLQQGHSRSDRCSQLLESSFIRGYFSPHRKTTKQEWENEGSVII